MEELYFVIGGLLGGILVDGEFEKLLEIIVEINILKLFVERSMEDYLIMLKDFEVKKWDNLEVKNIDSFEVKRFDNLKEKVRIVILLKLDKYVKEKILGGIFKVF